MTSHIMVAVWQGGLKYVVAMRDLKKTVKYTRKKPKQICQLIV